MVDFPFSVTVARYNVNALAFTGRHLKTEFKDWCRENLTPGYDLVIGMGKATVTLTDHTDADMLVLAWGPSQK